jgi:glyoxylase-like metal-dependent hydrolase (beta-lactamase superfamily II)
MKSRGALLLLFALLVAAAFRREGASQSNLVKQIAPGIYYREAERDKRIIANTGWIVFRDYAVVIDANYPWGARAVLADLKKTTDKPIKFVFDTHYHGDHAWGNSVWVDAGAAVVCSEECAEESLRKNTPSWAKNTESGEFSLKQYRLEHPQVTFRDRMVLDDGNMRLELLRLGPGHTRGDAVAYLPKQRILFTGDLAVNQAGNNMADADADHDNWLRALDAMAAKDVMTIVPGHGAPGTPEILRGQRAYLAAMVNGVRAAVQRGTPLEQVQKELDFSKHTPWGQNPTSNQNSIRAVYAKLSQQK